MESLRIVYLGIVELVIGVILITSLIPLLKELNLNYLIPLLWLFVIVLIVGTFFYLLKKIT